LDQLEIKFRDIIEKIWMLEKQTIDPSTSIDKIVRFQGELAQLYGDLDKFQVRVLSSHFSSSLRFTHLMT
jgi:hypothetical protein